MTRLLRLLPADSLVPSKSAGAGAVAERPHTTPVQGASRDEGRGQAQKRTQPPGRPHRRNTRQYCHDSYATKPFTNITHLPRMPQRHILQLPEVHLPEQISSSTTGTHGTRADRRQAPRLTTPRHASSQGEYCAVNAPQPHLLLLLSLLQLLLLRWVFLLLLLLLPLSPLTPKRPAGS